MIQLSVLAAQCLNETKQNKTNIYCASVYLHILQISF